MHIFFDTEFTGLTDDAKLISIGFVTQGGQEFYAELEDTYTINDCSEFCRMEVLPHLEGGLICMPLALVRTTLGEWLAACGPNAVLICDSPRDVSQFNELFPQGPPATVSLRVLGWWGNLQRRILNRGRRMHHLLGLRVHHALDDARVNKLILSRSYNPLL